MRWSVYDRGISANMASNCPSASEKTCHSGCAGASLNAKHNNSAAANGTCRTMKCLPGARLAHKPLLAPFHGLSDPACLRPRVAQPWGPIRNLMGGNHAKEEWRVGATLRGLGGTFRSR